MNRRRLGLVGGLLALGAMGYLGWSYKPGAAFVGLPSEQGLLQIGLASSSTYLDGGLADITYVGAGTGTVAIQQSAVYLGSLALADGGATNQAQGWLSNVVLIPQGTP